MSRWRVENSQADPNVQVEVMDVNLTGSGPAYLFRGGQGNPVKWERAKA